MNKTGNPPDPKAQSTVEYLILFSIVIAAMIIVALAQGNPFQQVYTDVLKERAASMDVSASALDGTNSTLSLTCGNGTIDPFEQCEVGNLNGQTCRTLGYHRGSLSCTSLCKYYKANCSNCGNGVVNSSEQCDGTAFNGQTCQSAGFAGGGTLQCNPYVAGSSTSCTLRVSACIP